MFRARWRNRVDVRSTTGVALARVRRPSTVAGRAVFRDDRGLVLPDGGCRLGTAWDNVRAHLDMVEPALLFLDPAALPGIEPGTHLPHPVLAVGYDEKSILIADGVRQDLVELSRANLPRGSSTAWSRGRIVTSS